MALRPNLQALATKLTTQYGDPVGITVYTTTPGWTQFDPPTVTETVETVMAVVTGASKWADGVTILSTDLAVLVSGAVAEADEGGYIAIGDKTYLVLQKHKILAAGLASAIRYFVRHG